MIQLLKQHLLGVATVCTMALVPMSAAAITVTNDPTGTARAGFGATDTLDWGQLGVSFTSVPVPTNVTSDGGISATVSAGGTLERRDLGNGWGGNFTDGSTLLWNRGQGTLTIDFGSLISGLGFQINPNVSDTTTFVELFDSALSSLGSFSLTTNDRGQSSGSFLGFTSDSDNIARVTIGQSGPNDFAINQLSLISGGTDPDGVVPLPASLPLLLGAFGVLGFVRRKAS